jgi:mycothiol system anti-sigma-R factor
MSIDPECGEDCREALEQLELLLDGELPQHRVTQVRQHLTACYPCTDRATFEEQLRAIVRQNCVEHAPTSLMERIRHRLDEGVLEE